MLTSAFNALALGLLPRTGSRSPISLLNFHLVEEIVEQLCEYDADDFGAFFTLLLGSEEASLLKMMDHAYHLPQEGFSLEELRCTLLKGCVKRCHFDGIGCYESYGPGRNLRFMGDGITLIIRDECKGCNALVSRKLYRGITTVKEYFNGCNCHHRLNENRTLNSTPVSVSFQRLCKGLLNTTVTAVNRYIRKPIPPPPQLSGDLKECLLIPNIPPTIEIPKCPLDVKLFYNTYEDYTVVMERRKDLLILTRIEPGRMFVTIETLKMFRDQKAPISERLSYCDLKLGPSGLYCGTFRVCNGVEGVMAYGSDKALQFYCPKICTYSLLVDEMLHMKTLVQLSGKIAIYQCIGGAGLSKVCHTL